MQVNIVSKELESRKITYQIAEIEEENFKASLFHLGNKKELVEEESVMFSITVAMKK